MKRGLPQPRTLLSTSGEEVPGKRDHSLCERNIRRDQANRGKCECHHPFQTAG